MELLVFSCRCDTPLSDMTFTKQLRTCKVPSDSPGRIATAHGFRSSFRDRASENGYRRDLAERALANTIHNATEAAYHRTDQLEQLVAMMQSSADFVAPSVKVCSAQRVKISYCLVTCPASVVLGHHLASIGRGLLFKIRDLD